MPTLSKEERLANLARGREQARQRKASDTPAPSLADVMAAIRNLSDSVQQVNLRVDAVEKAKPAVPSFTPMQPPEEPYRPANGVPTAGQAWGGLDGSQGKQEREGGGLVEELTVSGQASWSMPRFAVGQRIRLRDDVHHGTEDARRVRLKEEDDTPAVDEEGRPVFTRETTPITWGQLLERQRVLTCQRMLGKVRCGNAFRVGQVCSRCGEGPEIVKLLWQTKSGAWKYKVRVPGLTTRFGEAVAEWEIQPA